MGADSEDSNGTGINDGSGANNAAFNSGAVYVFSRTGITWSQQAYVKASNTEASDLFGFSMSLSSDGNTLAVGAFLESSNGTGINGGSAGTNNVAADAGAVYLY